MKYKVGDKVLIRSDLKADSNTHYGAAVVNNSMEKFIGKIVTISKVRGCRTEIEEDNGMWNWTDEMIERRTDMFTKDDLKVGYVVERRDGALKMVMPTSCGTVFYGDGTYHREDAFNSDMINTYGTREFDILKVWGYTRDLTSTLIVTTDDRPLLWERKEEPIEVTLQEIADWKKTTVDLVRIKE